VSEAAIKAPEGVPLEGQPFAQDTAGKEYFDSESHYRLLAANIRDHLRLQGGVVLVTGNPAPNGDLLVRQLAAEGSPRYRAIMIKGNAQASVEGLLNSYRTQLGISLAEETLKHAAGSPQPISPTRRHENNILVLDNAESLNFEVLEEFCLASSAEDELRPPLILLAGDSIKASLAAKSSAALNAAITAHFELHHLTHHEIASFIGFQMKAADLDHLDVFKPPIMELIDIYADGDPSVVNDLARRVLRAAPCSIPKSAPEDASAAPAAQEAPRGEIHPATSEPPVALDAGEPGSVQSDLAIPNDELDVEIDILPVSAEEVQTLVLGDDFTSNEETPVVASEDDLAPVEEPLAVLSDTPPIADEEVRAIATETSPVPVHEIRVSEPDKPPVQHEGLPMSAVGVAVAAEPLAAAEPELAPDFATHDDPIVAAKPSTTVEEPLVANAPEDRFDSSAHEEQISPTKRRSPWPRTAAVTVTTALAIMALVVGFRTGFLRGAENFHFPIDVAPYVATFRQFFQDLTHRSPVSDSASVRVAKDSAAQPLRTTKESNPGLLLEADPTNLRSAPVVKIEEPPAISLPPKSVPPKAPSPVVAVPVPAPPAVVVLTPPAVSVPEPSSREAPAVTVVEPPPPLPVPSPSAAAKAIAPAKRDTGAALPGLAGPGAQAPARTPASADSSLLLTRGDQLLASGDIIAARHYFELVAEAGDLRAALRLGKTYDPAFLKQIGARGIAGNPAVAKSWYLKAIASGDKDADMRLLQLMALYPE
jgi:type II secretory pathway predicted ATPase ExeA